jgi:hypothetical protein
MERIEPREAAAVQSIVKLIAGRVGSSAWLGCGCLCRRATRANRDFVTTPPPVDDNSGRKQLSRPYVTRLVVWLKMRWDIRSVSRTAGGATAAATIR